MGDDTLKTVKLRAEHNAWFLLATLYGRPGPDDWELQSKNCQAWNRYMANATPPDFRQMLIARRVLCHAGSLSGAAETPLSATGATDARPARLCRRAGPELSAGAFFFPPPRRNRCVLGGKENSGVSRDGVQNFPQTMDGDEIRSEKGVDGHTFNGKITVVLKMQGKSGIYFCLYFNQIPERANNPQHFGSPGRGLSTELCTSSVD
jgi:hypothetical protein